MTNLDAIALLRQIAGKRCETADTPHGSIIHLDIGMLGNRPDDAPGTRRHGEFCLTVVCPWRLFNRDFVVCDWNAEGGATGQISAALGVLVGAVVIEVRVHGPAWDIHLVFEGGMELQTFADTDPEDDAWFVLGIDGTIVSARPSVPDGGGLTIRGPA